jgi:methionine-gamma-lyase
MRPYGSASKPRAPIGPLAPDLTRSTTFAGPDAETLRAVGAGEQDGEFYPRYGHPAARRFESAVAVLEGAEGAVSFASGMAALHGPLCALLGAGTRWQRRVTCTAAPAPCCATTCRASA